jgi:hypothetical protein
MFGITKCGKCDSTQFKVKEIEPIDSAYKLIAVQCNSCGTPFGVTDYYSAGTLIKNQEKQMKEMSDRLAAMEHTLRQIAHALNQR